MAERYRVKKRGCMYTVIDSQAPSWRNDRAKTFTRRAAEKYRARWESGEAERDGG